MRMSIINGLHILHVVFTSWLVYNCYKQSKSTTNSVDQFISKPNFLKIDDKNSLFTSVWCVGSNSIYSRHCTFRNLCVSSKRKEYLFFYSNESAVVGLPDDDNIGEVLVDLSSVENHTVYNFRYTLVPFEHVHDFNIEFINETLFIFARFNPENIMHVLHDDILPLLVSLTRTSDSSRLFFTDGRPMGDYFSLYKLLLERHPILIQDLPTDKLTCFHKAYVGVNKDSTWYQYGFHKPQGPIRKTSLFQTTEINKFCRFVRQKMNISEYSDEDLALIVSRKQNRLILNEGDVQKLVNEVTGFKVRSVSLENDRLPELVKYFSQAKLVVGMHGSLLSLSMFLPPGAILIELFPYAVNHSHYTAYKTLVTMPGKKLVYRSWQNKQLKNTVVHPNNLPELGGIAHLPITEQMQINSSSEVPLHLCCYHPEWLYRIYQDTIVNITSLRILLEESIAERNQVGDDALVQGILRPSVINEITCHNSDNGLKFHWKPPWNIAYLKPKEITYELWIQDVVAGTIKAFSLHKTSTKLNLDCPDKEYYVWVRCIADERNGSVSAYPTVCKC